MLRCKDIYARATEYQERQLSWGHRLKFRLHLAMCRACRDFVAQMERTRGLLREIGRGEPSSPEENDLVELLRRHSKP